MLGDVKVLQNVKVISQLRLNFAAAYKSAALEMVTLSCDVPIVI